MMRTDKRRVALTSLGILLGLAGRASAAPTERFRADQRGDFVMFGNTLGFECFAGDADSPAPPDPIVGTADCSGVDSGTVDDSSPDIFWRSDYDDIAGSAMAMSTITAAQARSTAVLIVPDGATITYARIYWAGYLTGGAADLDVQIERPGSGLNALVNADDSWVVEDTSVSDGSNWYQATADISEIVMAAGPGPYRVGGVETANLPLMNSQHPIASWTAVVFYEDHTENPRNLVIFDGLDLVDASNDQQALIRGFTVPQGDPGVGYDAKLGVLTYEGELRWPGDQLLFNLEPLSNEQNPETNFFNCSRSYLGVPVSNEGDLPQLTGEPNSMAGVDMDVVDVTDYVYPNDTVAYLQALSDEDTFLLAAWVTSISTYQPDFITSTKAASDVNGDTLVPGDIIEYVVTAINTGNDDSSGTFMSDPLPDNVTFVPESIQIDGVAQTDRAGDDQAEYVAADHRIIARVGTGASPTQGGSIPAGGSVTITFQVQTSELGLVSNQALITAEGDRGSPAKDEYTDADPDEPGAQPTDVLVVPRGDSDGDGLTDEEEEDIGTDPFDADSDDDGVIDGLEPDPAGDFDGDGAINALDSDADDDGLFDGTEMGFDCSNPDTDLSAQQCVADADDGFTTTNPRDADTDDGGVEDGTEDRNQDGAIDDGEGDPTAGHGDDDDSDWDGLPDTVEEEVGTDPFDADSDDDGVLDGAEPQPSGDADGDGKINALDSDSDDDGLFDGTEMGLDCSNEDTDLSAGQCTPDADEGASTTNPLDADTDDGGVEDGTEDRNQNGAVDDGETEPKAGNGADDDTDWDGLPDSTEETLGSDPEDRDSDDDGVIDGSEPNPGGDADDDGIINVLDPDSDDDGLFDGTEMGLDCSEEDTDADAESCRADADEGETTTDPLNWDTDAGTVSDGAEDENLNGAIDGDERNPNYRFDDVPQDDGAGGATGTSGGASGATGDDGNAGGQAGSGIVYEEGVLEGGGCSCSVPGQQRSSGIAALLLALGGVLLLRKRS